MTPKYYVQTRDYTGRDCYEDKFHYEIPFDSIDEAKAWAVAHPGTEEEGYARTFIYKCDQNTISAALFSGDFGVTWEQP